MAGNHLALLLRFGSGILPPPSPDLRFLRSLPLPALLLLGLWASPPGGHRNRNRDSYHPSRRSGRSSWRYLRLFDGENPETGGDEDGATRQQRRQGGEGCDSVAAADGGGGGGSVRGRGEGFELSPASGAGTSEAEAGWGKGTGEKPQTQVAAPAASPAPTSVRAPGAAATAAAAAASSSLSSSAAAAALGSTTAPQGGEHLRSSSPSPKAAAAAAVPGSPPFPQAPIPRVGGHPPPPQPATRTPVNSSPSPGSHRPPSPGGRLCSPPGGSVEGLVASAGFGGLLFLTVLLAGSPWTGEEWAPSPGFGGGWSALRCARVRAWLLPVACCLMLLLFFSFFFLERSHGNTQITDGTTSSH